MDSTDGFSVSPPNRSPDRGDLCPALREFDADLRESKYAASLFKLKMVESRKVKSMNQSGSYMTEAGPPSTSLHPCQKCTNRHPRHNGCSSLSIPACLPNRMLNSQSLRKKTRSPISLTGSHASFSKSIL
ncbi:uncharacterized protein LOC109835746 [Asparagus officinalis]|uniref:uncharacterized protein LOC109835746 n=1 Tax=Asparagus officinalis TaxID=4686 RepID=UPI00098E4AFC|nr:uncharacterized protein LOC109835746 [Asparagus officinalis]